MLKIAAISLGCEKNLIDTEVMLGIMNSADCRIVTDLEKADIIIINTCGFIESAKQESINNILSAAQYKDKGRCRLLAVTGCLVQKYREELLEGIPEIDIVLGTGEIDKIAGIIAQAWNNEKDEEKQALRFRKIGNPGFNYNCSLPRLVTSPQYLTYVKIADGCNNHCSYCVIPEVRGRYRSRNIDDITAEAKKYIEQGSRELIFIAQDTTYYGLDLYRKTMLPELLERVSDLDNCGWIRLLYCYPNNFGRNLINCFNRIDSLCNYVDLPLQHINDDILRQMNRHISSCEIKDLINRLRDSIDDITLRTTFIVGFPGETEEQFEELLQFVDDTQFDKLGAFTYSQEPGTRAAQLPGQIEEEVKLRRYDQLMQLQNGISLKKNNAKINRKFSVLTEGTSYLNNELYYYGRTQMDAPEVDGIVYFKSRTFARQPGDVVDVKITGALEYDLIGVAAYEFGQ